MGHALFIYFGWPQEFVQHFLANRTRTPANIAHTPGRPHKILKLLTKNAIYAYILHIDQSLYLYRSVCVCVWHERFSLNRFFICICADLADFAFCLRCYFLPPIVGCVLILFDFPWYKNPFIL